MDHAINEGVTFIRHVKNFLRRIMAFSRMKRSQRWPRYWSGATSTETTIVVNGLTVDNLVAVNAHSIRSDLENKASELISNRRKDDILDLA